MNRREFISTSAGTLGALGLSAKSRGEEKTVVSEERAGAPRKAPPNVLILMTDQHRRTCMGAAGDAVAITPNLDKLAAESIRFSDAYCTNPVCSPSRATIMTGLWTHNLTFRGKEYQGSGMPYSPKHKTIGDEFARAGYMTALIGKMHMIDAQTHGFNYHLEFNDYFEYLGPKTIMYADEVDHSDSGAGQPQIPELCKTEGYPWKGDIKKDGRLGPVAVGNPSKMELEDHFESFVTRESINFLEQYANQDQPFLLVASLLKPHEPFMPARQFAEMFQADKMTPSKTWGKADLKTLPESVVHSIEKCPFTPELLHASAVRERMAYYYGNLAQSDACIGEILAALTRLGLDQNTIVVYTSDHGEMLGDLGLWGKLQFYDGSCGVPLMFRVPGGAPGVCKQPVSLVSLKATIEELCGVPVTQSDGESFAYLVDEPRSHKEYGPVFAEYDLGGKNAKYMILDGGYKYTLWLHFKDELYDMRNDPEEMHNLAEKPEYSHIVERLKQRLLTWHRPKELDQA